MTTTKSKKREKPTIEKAVGPQVHRLSLGKLLTKRSETGSVAGIMEHRGGVITREESDAGTPGSLSREIQLIEAKEIMDRNELHENDSPFRDTLGQLEAFRRTVVSKLSSLDDSERPKMLMEILVDILKPQNLPGELDVEAHFERTYTDQVFRFAVAPELDYGKNGPLVAADIVTPNRERMVHHEELGGNLFGIDSPFHLALVGVGVLRLEGYPAYIGMGRRKDSRVPGRIEKLPMMITLNRGIGAGTEGRGLIGTSANLAYVSGFSQVLPVVESIDILTDKAVLSMMTGQSAFYRVRRKVKELVERTGMVLSDGSDGYAAGTPRFDDENHPTSPKERFEAYCRVRDALLDEELLSEVGMAGVELWEAYKLWPDPAEGGHDYMNVVGPMVQIVGLDHPDPNKVSLGMVKRFVFASYRLMTELLGLLPKQTVMRPENARKHVAAYKRGDELIGATQKAFNENREMDEKALETGTFGQMHC